MARPGPAAGGRGHRAGDPQTGVWVRCYLDALHPTPLRHRPQDGPRGVVGRLLTHRRQPRLRPAATYASVMEWLGLPFGGLAFVIVEKAPPYQVGCGNWTARPRAGPRSAATRPRHLRRLHGVRRLARTACLSTRLRAPLALYGRDHVRLSPPTSRTGSPSHPNRSRSPTSRPPHSPTSAWTRPATATSRCSFTSASGPGSTRSPDRSHDRPPVVRERQRRVGQGHHADHPDRHRRVPAHRPQSRRPRPP